MNGKEAADDDVFTVAMMQYPFKNIENSFDLTLDEIEKNGKPVEIATDAPSVLEEYFNDHPKLKLDGEPRLIIR